MQSSSIASRETESKGITGASWPILSDTALYGLAGEIVAAVCHTSEADPAAVLGTLLTAIGIMAGREAGVRVGDDWVHARLFTVIVGRSARARKGTSEKGPKRVIRAAEAFLATARFPLSQPLNWGNGPLSSGEGLISAIRDADNIEGDDGVSDKRFLVVESEFANVFRAAQRLGNTLSTVIRAAWDGGTLAPLTKSSRIAATKPHVGIVGHITQEELAQLMSKTDIYNGFGNRFLWFCAKRPRLLPLAPGMSEEIVGLLGNRLAMAMEAASHFAEVIFSSDADALYRDLYPELSADRDNSAWSIVTARAEGQVIRLALCYALIDGSSVIEIVHLRAALAVWEYCDDSARYLFENVVASPLAQRITDSLRQGPMSTSQLHKLFSGHADARVLGDTLQMLVDQAGVLKTEHATKGRPATLYSLPPGEK